MEPGKQFGMGSIIDFHFLSVLNESVCCQSMIHEHCLQFFCLYNMMRDAVDFLMMTFGTVYYCALAIMTLL